MQQQLQAEQLLHHPTNRSGAKSRFCFPTPITLPRGFDCLELSGSGGPGTGTVLALPRATSVRGGDSPMSLPLAHQYQMPGELVSPQMYAYLA